MTSGRDVVTDACPTCGKPVYADEGYYSITGEHWQCHASKQSELQSSVVKVKSLVGEKTSSTRRGEGESVTKLKGMIEAAMRKKFDAMEVQDVAVYLTSPTWCRDIYDVQRFEGSAVVDGIRRSFGCWCTVTECLKYREVEFDDDWPIMGLSPVYETRRSRKAVHPQG